MPGRKKRHLKCSGAENPGTYTSVVGEAGKAAGDAVFPAQHRGVRQAVDEGLCLGFGAAGLARRSPGTATRVGAKMKDTERHPAAGFTQMLAGFPL